MMFFFDTVQTFSTTGKSAKGKALQEMAMRFKDVLVQGDYAPVNIVTAMRDKAAEIDKHFNRGRLTFIEHICAGDSGQISAVPVSDAPSPNEQPYFRLYYHKVKVARTATIPEAVALTKGGEA